MHSNSLKFRANREHILATATRNIAEVGFAHITLRGIMDDTGLSQRSMHPYFPTTTSLLAVVCERHANALIEATGYVEPDDPRPPRAVLVASAARVLACIHAYPHAHTVLMRDRACLPPALRANLDYLDEVAAFQVDCAWSALRPDLAAPERVAGLTKPLRTLLLHWPEWREPGPRGHPDAAAERAVAMVEATIDLALPASTHTPLPLFPHPSLPAPDAPERHAAYDADLPDPPIRHAPHDAPCHAPSDAQPTPEPAPAPAHPGLTLRDALDRHRLPPTLAAARLGIPRQRLHQLTRGTRAITPDTALRLEALLGEHAETWMARQARHDIEAARRAAMGDSR
jgi:addiction module HigA family antidote